MEPVQDSYLLGGFFNDKKEEDFMSVDSEPTDSKPKEPSNKIFSMLNYLWKNPLIKISQKEETLDPIELGDSALSTTDDCDS